MEVEAIWLGEFVFGGNAAIGGLFGRFGVSSLLLLQSFLQLIGSALLPRHLFLALL